MWASKLSLESLIRTKWARFCASEGILPSTAPVTHPCAGTEKIRGSESTTRDKSTGSFIVNRGLVLTLDAVCAVAADPKRASAAVTATHDDFASIWCMRKLRL